MNINILEKEVQQYGINEVSKKYKLKKNKIKKLLDNKDVNEKRNITKNNISCNAIKNNITGSNIIEEVVIDNITKDITNCNINIEKLKRLLENTEEILKIVKREKLKKIKIKENKSMVTTLRVNEEVYRLVKIYSKENNETITNIINFALIEYLQNNRE